MFADDEDSTLVAAPTVYPGHPVTAEIESRMSRTARRNEAEPYRIKLGPGLLQTSPSTIVPVRVGRLCDQRGRRFWLHSRYNCVCFLHTPFTRPCILFSTRQQGTTWSSEQ